MVSRLSRANSVHELQQMEPAPEAAGAGRSEEDPVLTHADALDALVSRCHSWVVAAEGLRSNIKALANEEKQSASRLRKISGAAVNFLQAPVARGSVPPQADTLATASRGCFESVPAQMAAFHEEIAGNLILLDQKQAKAVESLSKKHKASIEAVVFSIYDRVEKSREELEARAVSLQTLVHGGDSHAQVWLSQVQQAAARREEREASSQYCQQARALWEQAFKFEAEISSKMREVMVLFIQCQSAAVGKLDLSLEAHSRTMKAIDSAADWKLYTGQDDVARALQPDVSTDWREWRSILSEIAKAEEAKGDLMSAGLPIPPRLSSPLHPRPRPCHSLLLMASPAVPPLFWRPQVL
jgi:hypothetical protein